MTTITYEIRNALGMHARPAALLAQTCVNLASQVTVRCEGRTANGGNVLQIMQQIALRDEKRHGF